MKNKTAQWVFIILLGGALATYGAVVTETWESQAHEDPFTGQGDLTWTGDLSEYLLTSATWPSGTTSDFAGNNSLRTQSSGSAVQDTVVTAHSTDFLADMVWSVYFGGNSATITSGKDVNFYLALDSSNITDIEAGNVNGYRLRLGNTTDAFIFEEANGGGWSALRTDAIGAANINQGWNVRVERDTDGNWSYGYANGVIGQTPTLSYSVTDTTITSMSYLGMGWRAPSGDAQDFGFDNFSLNDGIVPEPSTFGFIAVASAILWAVRRRRNS